MTCNIDVAMTCDVLFKIGDASFGEGNLLCYVAMICLHAYLFLQSGVPLYSRMLRVLDPLLLLLLLLLLILLLHLFLPLEDTPLLIFLLFLLVSPPRCLFLPPFSCR